MDLNCAREVKGVFSGIVIQALLLGAAMLGISFAEPNSYTKFAAGSVASVAAMTQVIASDRDADLVRQALSPLADSGQSGWQ